MAGGLVFQGRAVCPGEAILGGFSDPRGFSHGSGEIWSVECPKSSA